MPATRSVGEVEFGGADPLVDDGLPLVDLEARPIPSDTAAGTVRPFAFKFLTTHEADPDFLRMSGDDVTFTIIHGHIFVDDH